MKKSFLLFLIQFLFISIGWTQATVTDFNLTDCDGKVQHLYSMLDKGKIVVIIYEHQCSSCTAGSKNIKTVIDKYYSGDTNIVIIYLDNGGYSCTATKNWVTNNNLLAGSCIAYSSDYLSPYGSGMPVIAIGAGSGHFKFMSTNTLAAADTGTIHTSLKTAKDALINGIQNVNENYDFKTSLIEFTNGNCKIAFDSKQDEKLRIELVDLSGKIIKKFPDLAIKQGKTITNLQTGNLQPGSYMLTITSLKEKSILKLIQSH
jgi:hypothetical protein